MIIMYLLVKVILPDISKYTHFFDGFSVDSLEPSERNYDSNVLLIFICFFYGVHSVFELMLCIADDGIHIGFCSAKQVRLIMVCKHAAIL